MGEQLGHSRQVADVVVFEVEFVDVREGAVPGEELPKFGVGDGLAVDDD